MLNLFSNPVFIPILLIGVGIGLWWILSSLTLNKKKNVLNLFVDSIFYFLVIAFIGNGLVHFSEIVALPYSALILSNKAVSFSFLVVVAYSFYRYLKKDEIEKETLFSVFQLVALLGVINQVYYYVLYKSPLLVGLILLFSSLLLVASIVPLKGNRWIILSLLGLVVHLLITRNQAVIYFGFVVSPALVGLMIIEWGLFLIALLRRQKQSEQM